LGLDITSIPGPCARTQPEIPIFDELCYLPLETEAAHLFFQLVSRCYERVSTPLISNRPELLGDTAAMIAMLDRHPEPARCSLRAASISPRFLNVFAAWTRVRFPARPAATDRGSALTHLPLDRRYGAGWKATPQCGQRARKRDITSSIR
jgi:hypothetical protein